MPCLPADNKLIFLHILSFTELDVYPPGERNNIHVWIFLFQDKHGNKRNVSWDGEEAGDRTATILVFVSSITVLHPANKYF